MIENTLLHFKTKTAFNTELEADNIQDQSITFIKDSKEIVTHGDIYKTVNWSILELVDDAASLENFIYAKKKSLFKEALNNGNILDEAIVFIEDTKEIWNHGTYFYGSTADLSNIEASIENIINNKADKDEIPTKISQLEDDKGILIGEETSDTLDDVETNTYIKYVAQTLTEEQQKQAKKKHRDW